MNGTPLSSYSRAMTMAHSWARLAESAIVGAAESGFWLVLGVPALNSSATLVADLVPELKLASTFRWRYRSHPSVLISRPGRMGRLNRSGVTLR
jgi:hypothetical protein